MPRKKVPLRSMSVTLVQARDLAMQELGTTKGLKKLEDGPVSSYCMELGNLLIRIFPDARSERIVLTVSMEGMAGHLIKLYHPNTLCEDHGAQKWVLRREQEEAVENWVCERGLDYCRETIYRIWNDKHSRPRRPKRATKVPDSSPAPNA